MIWAITAALLFAGLDLLWRMVLAQSPMWTALLGRSAVSAALLLSFAFFFGGAGEDLTQMGWEDAFDVFALPMATGIGGLVLFSLALRNAPVYLVVPVVNMTGLSVVCWDWVLNGASMRMPGAIGLAIVLASCGLLVFLIQAVRHNATLRKEVTLGLIFSALGVLCWGRGYVAYGRSLQEVDAFTLAASVEVAILTAACLFHVRHAGRQLHLSKAPLGLLLLMGVGVSLASGALCTAYAIMPAYKVGVATILTPVVATLLARWVNQEKMSRLDAAAFFLIMAAQVVFVWSEWGGV